MPTHPEYTLNCLCARTPQPFFIHVFLGPIPRGLDFSMPIDTEAVPSWAGQLYVMPSSAPQDSGYASYTDGGAHKKEEGGETDWDSPATGYTDSPTTYHHQQQQQNGHAASNGHTTQVKTRTALPLTTPLMKHLPHLYTMPVEEVREFLDKNLRLKLIREDMEHRGEEMPEEDGQELVRAWVVRQEIDESVWGSGRVRGSEVVWGNVPES